MNPVTTQKANKVYLYIRTIHTRIQPLVYDWKGSGL